MLTTVTGIVIRERSVGEQDKFIDLLTAEHGVLEVSVRGAKKITSRHGAASQLYAYGQYCLDSRRDRYYLNSAQVNRIFYDLRQDLTRLSLANYFSELIGFAVGAEHENSDILRLLLNTLHYLEEGSRPVPLLKALFELRFLTELGMMPDIVCCDVCGEYAPSQLIFRLQAGNFVCSPCAGELAPDREQMPVSGSVLQAVRHIVLSDFDRLFHFRLSDPAQSALSILAERYTILHLERQFRTLDFYKSLENLP